MNYDQTRLSCAHCFSQDQERDKICRNHLHGFCFWGYHCYRRHIPRRCWDEVRIDGTAVKHGILNMDLVLRPRRDMPGWAGKLQSKPLFFQTTNTRGRKRVRGKRTWKVQASCRCLQRRCLRQAIGTSGLYDQWAKIF